MDPTNVQVQSLVHNYDRMQLVSRGSVALGRPLTRFSIEGDLASVDPTSRLTDAIVPQNDSMEELQRVQQEIMERI